MISFEFINSSFDQKYTSLYGLFVLAGTDSLSFFISDNKGEILLLRDYYLGDNVSIGKDNLLNVLSSDNILNLTFGRSKFGIVSKKNVLVPEGIYRDDERMEYLASMSSLTSSEVVESNDLSGFLAKIVYPLDTDIKESIIQRFRNPAIINGAVPLLKKYRIIAWENSGDTVFVNVRQGYSQIAVFLNGNLQFFNSYNHTGSKDMLYFVLLVYDQFGLDTSEIPLKISGKLEKNSSAFSLLYKYIKSIEILEYNKIEKIKKIPKDIPPHYYFDLFCL